MSTRKIYTMKLRGTDGKTRNRLLLNSENQAIGGRDINFTTTSYSVVEGHNTLNFGTLSAGLYCFDYNTIVGISAQFESISGVDASKEHSRAVLFWIDHSSSVSAVFNITKLFQNTGKVTINLYPLFLVSNTFLLGNLDSATFPRIFLSSDGGIGQQKSPNQDMPAGVAGDYLMTVKSGNTYVNPIAASINPGICEPIATGLYYIHCESTSIGVVNAGSDEVRYYPLNRGPATNESNIVALMGSNNTLLTKNGRVSSITLPNCTSTPFEWSRTDTWDANTSGKRTLSASSALSSSTKGVFIYTTQYRTSDYTLMTDSGTQISDKLITSIKNGPLKVTGSTSFPLTNHSVIVIQDAATSIQPSIVYNHRSSNQALILTMHVTTEISSVRINS